MDSNDKVKFALPKGYLRSRASELLEEAGYNIEGYNSDDRNYRPSIQDRPDIKPKILKPQEIPMYIEEGLYDIGITGYDWVLEVSHDHRVHSPQTSKIDSILDLKYGKVELVLAVPKAWSDVNSFSDLLSHTGKTTTIATEYLNISNAYVIAKKKVEPTLLSVWRRQRRRHASEIRLTQSFGATEGKPPDDADAIIDIASQRKRTIKANELKVIDSVFQSLSFPRYSTAHLICNKESFMNSPLNSPSKSVIREIKENLSEVL